MSNVLREPVPEVRGQMSEGSLDRRADGMAGGRGHGCGRGAHQRDTDLNVRTRSDKLTDRERPAAGGEMDAAGTHMEDGANGGL